MPSRCLAAAATPLADRGERLDAAAFAPMTDFLVAGGVDGLLALGTTGEGLLLATDERARAVELFVAAARGRVAVVAHCGAPSTRETCDLARRAVAAGADAVAVVGPGFFSFDEESLLAHFVAAARAAEPLPFYAYEFAARTGYGLAIPFLRRLKERAPNLRGLKVSNADWSAVAPFLDPSLGLEILLGAEALIARGIAAGAAGAVSGLAAAFPDLVAAHVRAPDDAGSARVARLRASLAAFPFQAAVKSALRAQGVPIDPDVRAPLRVLSPAEDEAVRALVAATRGGGGGGGRRRGAARRGPVTSAR